MAINRISFGPPKWKRHRESSRLPFRVMIPTRDSAAWITIFLDQYKRAGIEPLYVVDARSRDNTLGLLREAGADFVEFSPSGDFVEAGMIEFGSKHAGTEWVLRMDDDELPSSALLNWVRDVGVNSLNQLWFISRRELFLNEGEFRFSRSLGRYSLPYRPDFLSPQGRLHHVDRVKYIRQVHTTGFAIPQCFSFAPEDAFFIHCNCLLRSPAERLAKIRNYEAIRPLSTWGVADEYLPEMFGPLVHNPSSDGLDEFADFLSRLPIFTDSAPLSLTDAERDLMYREINRLHSENQRLRENASPSSPTSADEFRWLLRFPSFMWRPIAEALCTFGRGRRREIGVAIWNYRNALS
jgi:hypothetical protein